VLAAAAVCSIAGAAYAAGTGNPHLNSDPSFTDGGTSLTATGSVFGLGSGNTGPTAITMTAMANPTATCSNKGNNKPPGHNPASVVITGTDTIKPSAIVTNGGTPFTVSASLSQTTIPSDSPDFSCPSSNWTEVINDLAFTSAIISVNGAAVANCTFAAEFNGGTQNGAVPPGEVSCNLNP
jgi:hypothetical protein